MASYTPGPWFAVNDGTAKEPMMSVKAARIAGKPPRHEVAICATGDSSQEMENANARLIAAAPDLLAACRATYAWSYAEHHGLGSFDQRSTLCAHSESLVAKALAYARGEPSPEYKGSKRLIIWPNVELETSSIEEADALVKSAFDHEAKAGGA